MRLSATRVNRMLTAARKAQAQRGGAERIREVIVHLPADDEHPAGVVLCAWSSPRLPVYEVRE